MTTASVLDDLVFIPRWLGEPLYPNGFPINSHDYSYKSKTLIELYVQDSYTEDELQCLKEYLIYHLHAPIWDLAGQPSRDMEKAREASLAIKTKEDLQNASGYVWKPVLTRFDDSSLSFLRFQISAYDNNNY